MCQGETGFLALFLFFNAASFLVRLESEKYIGLSERSPLSGGRPGRTKRKMDKSRAAKGGAEKGAAEDDE